MVVTCWEEECVLSNSSGMYLLILSANSGSKKSNDTTVGSAEGSPEHDFVSQY